MRDEKAAERDGSRNAPQPAVVSTQNASTSPLRTDGKLDAAAEGAPKNETANFESNAILEKVSSNEEKIKILMDKLEQQEAQRLEDAKVEEAQPPVEEEPPEP